MSLALREAARLKPEVRLAQAVSEFEASLSSENKALFNTRRSQARSSPPTVQDVRVFTAEIDRVHGGRCLAIRFMSVVVAVQKFVSFGDIIIGGSQNIVACGVWSVVRLALSLISNSYSHLEKLSEVFFQVGRSAPQVEKMAQLYHQSRDLQSAVCEYFTVVVNICHSMLKFTQKSTFAKLQASSIDTILARYKTDLISWGETIRDEVHYQMANRAEREAEAHRNSRSLVSEIFKSSTAKERLRTRQKMLDFCSQHDYVTAWKQSRSAGNTDRFRKCPNYRNWVADPDNQTLVYTGRLGAGKSVMLANIVDDLQIITQAKDDQGKVAFFFARHDEPESLKPRNVIGSLAQQILSQSIDFRDAKEIESLQKTYERARFSGDFARMLALLASVFDNKNSERFVVIDGLDEMKEYDQLEVLERLRDLQKATKFMICTSARQDSSDVVKNCQRLFQNTTVAAMPANTSDIERFISSELQRRIRSESIIVGNTKLIVAIKDTLCKGSQGMFLWAALFLDFLCEMETDNEIMEALKHLPEDLADTYSRILDHARKRTSKTARSYQRQILELITVAQRQMTILEMREALSVTPSDTNWNESQLVNDLYSTLKCCGGLVVVDEEELTLRFVHHSVKQYLLDGAKEDVPYRFSMEEAHQKMSDAIITYFNFSVFEHQLSTRVFHEVPADATLRGITQSTQTQMNPIGQFTMNIMQKKSARHRSVDIRKPLARLRPVARDSAERLALKNYGKQFWSYHLAYSPPLTDVISKLLQRLFNRKFLDLTSIEPSHLYLLLNKAAAIDVILRASAISELSAYYIRLQTDEDISLPIVSLNGHNEIADFFSKLDETPANFKTSDTTPFMLAITWNHQKTVRDVIQWVNLIVDDENLIMKIIEKGRKEALIKVLSYFIGPVDIRFLHDEIASEPEHLAAWVLRLAIMFGKIYLTKLILERYNHLANEMTLYDTKTPLSRVIELRPMQSEMLDLFFELSLVNLDWLIPLERKVVIDHAVRHRKLITMVEFVP